MFAKPRRRQHGATVFWSLIGVLAAAALLFALYIWMMLHWSYSSGERAGWVQKLSRKGYLCKTWEGEMAMVSLPGSVPEKFFFTVPDDAVAEQINEVMGKRVALHYEEHIWLPTSCFGDTRHFVTRVKVIEGAEAPMQVPSDLGNLPKQSEPTETPGATEEPAPQEEAAPPVQPPPPWKAPKPTGERPKYPET